MGKFEIDSFDTIGGVRDAIKQAEYLADDLSTDFFDKLCCAYRDGHTLDANAMAQMNCERWRLMCNLLGSVLAQAEDLIDRFETEHRRDRDAS